MCQGQYLRNELRRPASTLTITPVTARLAVTNVELAAARARLVESMAQLERSVPAPQIFADAWQSPTRSEIGSGSLHLLWTLYGTASPRRSSVLRPRLGAELTRVILFFDILATAYQQNRRGTISIGLSEAGDLCTSR
ncbi:hypothetical protein M5K25_014722 [Dendrobium thyrsiflorum]|uniref:Uncharacterized protein n=1 Tax=Dendrobium thyrsiflorum TaxID=117978 RepID=A0ABD0UP93_DENTH